MYYNNILFTRVVYTLHVGKINALENNNHNNIRNNRSEINREQRKTIPEINDIRRISHVAIFRYNIMFDRDKLIARSVGFYLQ